jgi:hypothetical protein
MLRKRASRGQSPPAEEKSSAAQGEALPSAESVPWLSDLPDGPLMAPEDSPAHAPARRAPNRPLPASGASRTRRARPPADVAMPQRPTEPAVGAATALGDAAAEVLASVHAASLEAQNALERLATGRAEALEQASATYADELAKHAERMRAAIAQAGESRVAGTKDLVDTLGDQLEERGATEIGGVKRAGLQANQQIERAVQDAVLQIEQMATMVSERLKRMAGRASLFRGLSVAALVFVGVLAVVGIILAMNAG